MDEIGGRARDERQEGRKRGQRGRPTKEKADATKAHPCLTCSTCRSKKKQRGLRFSVSIYGGRRKGQPLSPGHEERAQLTVTPPNVPSASISRSAPGSLSCFLVFLRLILLLLDDVAGKSEDEDEPV